MYLQAQLMTNDATMQALVDSNRYPDQAVLIKRLSDGVAEAMTNTANYLRATDIVGAPEAVHPHSVARVLVRLLDHASSLSVEAQAAAKSAVDRRLMVYVNGAWESLLDTDRVEVAKTPDVATADAELDTITEPAGPMPVIDLFGDNKKNGWADDGKRPAEMNGWAKEMVDIAPTILLKPLYEFEDYAVRRRAAATLLVLIVDALKGLPEGVTAAQVTAYCTQAVAAIAQTVGGEVALGSITDTKHSLAPAAKTE